MTQSWFVGLFFSFLAALWCRRSAGAAARGRSPHCGAGGKRRVHVAAPRGCAVADTRGFDRQRRGTQDCVRCCGKIRPHRSSIRRIFCSSKAGYSKSAMLKGTPDRPYQHHRAGVGARQPERPAIMFRRPKRKNLLSAAVPDSLKVRNLVFNPISENSFRHVIMRALREAQRMEAEPWTMCRALFRQPWHDFLKAEVRYAVRPGRRRWRSFRSLQALATVNRVWPTR